MGRSLLDNTRTHYAVVTDGTHYGIFTDRYVLMNGLEKNIGLYDYQLDPFFNNNLELQSPEITDKLKRYLYAYIPVCIRCHCSKHNLS